MNKNLKRILSIALICAMVGSTSIAEAVTVRYTGTADPDSMVGFMLVDADADADNLERGQIRRTDILKADSNGNVSKTIEIGDAIIDETTGKISNYKAVSSIELTETVLGNNIDFERYSVKPVEENGILYVPIEETFEIIGKDTVIYNYDEETKTYTGEANNGEFIIVMGEDTVDVDWVDVELPDITKEISGTNMMPAYAIKYLLKTGDVEYISGNNYFELSDGVLEKYTVWDDDISDVIDKLPKPTGTIMSPSWYLSESSRVGIYPDSVKNVTVFDSVVDVEIDGKSYRARQIESNPNEYGELTSIQSQAWPNRSSATLKAGEIGLISFKARATNITDESGAANVQVVFENASNWNKAVSKQIPILGYWQQYYLPAYNAYYDMPNNYKSKFQICVGGKPMTIQIADLSIVSYGENEEVKKLLMPEREGYKGIENDHVWRQEAWNRIEKYRKEDISIEVVDGSGNPVPNANVAVNMTDNEFMFGTALCESEVLDQYIDTGTLRGKTLDGFMDNDMNTGVVADMLKAAGVVNTDANSGINMVNEFTSRGKRVRGHAIYWDGEGLLPFDRAKQMTYQEIYDRTMDYTRSLAYAVKGGLEQWDVLNEPHDSAFVRGTYNTTRLYTDVFKEVKKVDPDVKLFVNETGMEGKPDRKFQDRIPTFLNIVKQMQTEGAPIDGIGIQAHCTTYYYPQGFYHQLDECSQIVDEVAVTEYDFQNIDDTYAPNHLEDTMLATFSHPKATAFIVWGIEDSMHWRWTDDAPFFNRDWSAKPAYATWQRLINEDFATNILVRTDANGKATVRAFRGDYAITCEYNGKMATAKLGNTVDGGSSVRFVVGNPIKYTVSNDVREQAKQIKFKNMTEAKKELDGITPTYYKSVISDHNFKGSEMNELVRNGGELNKDSSYVCGKTWGSLNGTSELLYGGNWGATIVHSKGTARAGDIRRRALGTERYDGTELHHETMFYTLDTNVGGKVKISTGVSTDTFEDTMLADIMYDNGRYYVKTIDGQEIALEKDKFYTLDTAITDSGIKYKVETAEGVIGEHTYATETVDAMSITDVCYKLNSDCEEGDIFMLHNSRLFEYKDGELIKFGKTDYETYLIDESMRDFDISKVEHIGTSLCEAPDDWKHIGASQTKGGLAYIPSGQYFGTVAYTPTVGENSIAKGFAKINEGESLELTFENYLGVYTHWMDTTGHDKIIIGSHDKSTTLSVLELRYRQYSDDNGKPYEIWNLDLNGANSPVKKTELGYNSVFARSKNTVKLTLTPSTDGETYDAYLSIKARTGTDEIIAKADGILTKEQAMSLDTLFISSNIFTSGTKYSGNIMLGAQNVRLRRYGSSMYKDSEAVLADGEEASLGISYNNRTNVYTQARVIIAGFKGEQMTYCEARDYTMNPREGAFGFDLEVKSDQADYYKVFLIDGAGNISPLKEEDAISILK